MTWPRRLWRLSGRVVSTRVTYCSTGHIEAGTMRLRCAECERCIVTSERAATCSSSLTLLSMWRRPLRRIGACFRVLAVSDRIVQLLFDSDAFCKLGLAGLLEPCARLFGVTLQECGRLPGLPHMLRRGRLVRKYGVKTCTQLLSLCECMPIVPRVDGPTLTTLAAQPGIDPGEALLFAQIAEHGGRVVSGDKRCLASLSGIPDLHRRLDRRIAIIEGVLLELCARRDPEEMRDSVRLVRPYDTTIDICVLPNGFLSVEGLQSYYCDAASTASPLRLWTPAT